MDQKNPYIPTKAKIVDARDETPDVKLVRVSHKIKHLPGQFVELSLFGYGEATLGIASYSGRYIDLYIRKVGNTTNAISKLKKGDFVFVRGPYGNGFPINELVGTDIVIIGGGTGVVPLKSMIEYIKNNRDDFGKVDIYFGFRDYNSILFKGEIKELSKRFNFNVTLDNKDKRWKGNVGLITSLIENNGIKFGSKILLCGPPIMIKSAIEILLRKQADEKNIYVSYERLMSCGIGKCGHCMIKHVYVCKDGPVFRYDFAKTLVD